jgi:hypothetical protein
MQIIIIQMGGSFKKPFSHTNDSTVTDHSGITTQTHRSGLTIITYPCGCEKKYYKDSLESIVRCSDHIHSEFSLIIQDFLQMYIRIEGGIRFDDILCTKYNVPNGTYIYGKSNFNFYSVTLPCNCEEFYENTRFIRKTFCSKHLSDFNTL